MERIWNKSELEKMDGWKSVDSGFENSISKNGIHNNMLGKTVEWCKTEGWIVTPEMIAKAEQPKTGTEILQKAIEQLDNMTPEEVQQRSKDRGIVIPDEPKTAIAANGNELVVGERYTSIDWRKNEYIKILAIGKNMLFVIKFEDSGEQFETIVVKKSDWLPYTKPKEEQKPLEGYQKFYVLGGFNNATYIDTIYAKSKEAASKIILDVKAVYTEQEAIDLGLKI